MLSNKVTALATIVAAFLAVLIITPGITSLAAPESNSPVHVSSAACAECHRQEHAAWSDSHHSWALRQPTPENVLGNFDNQVFEHRGIRSRFYKRGNEYLVKTDGPDGKLAEFDIKYTVGVEPLQQYLVELDKGRLQALDIAWDTEQKRWFHLYPDQKLKSGDGLHWSGPYKNWNARCAECHQTGFKKNYSPKSARYQSTWSELTIGCEACHGPGSVHIQWAKKPETFLSEKPAGVDEMGLTVTLPLKTANDEIQLCARCHSRRSPLGADSPSPGDKLADHYKLALLRNGLYHADGQINDEVYVYGSFLQSKMYARGVRCSNCHEPHSGALVAEGNTVCTQCHNPAGNTKFQTLKKATYDSPSHHHHKAGSEGEKCVSCHMPAKNFMRVDPRRDHSFRVPRPDLSAKLGTPNACANCHQDKTAKWATATLKEWFPNGRTGTPHYGEKLHAGRNRPRVETADKLVNLALDTQEPSIVRATALDLLRQSITPEAVKRISALLNDKNVFIREAAVRLFDQIPVKARIADVAPLLSDPVKSVRLEAARLMMGASLEGLTKKDQAAARNAISAYQNSLLARADFPESQMQIAGLAMFLRDFRTAQKALQTALSMDPQLAPAWLTLARIQSALRQSRQALNTLEKAAQKVPENAAVQFQLGELYTQSRQHDRAIIALEQSRKLSGDTPVLLDLLAINTLASGNLEKARIYADELVRKYPGHQPSPLVRQILKMPR
jgi:predicted CXXCH cytochrome family protein